MTFKTVYEAAGKCRLEHEPESKTFMVHWSSYHGAHFRAGVEQLLALVKAHGVLTYITDVTRVTDVPLQEDFQWIENTVKPALKAGGLKHFVTVMPASSIAKMATNRIGKVASSAGVDVHQVASVAEAIDVAHGKQAA
jgi:hypothetical protein